MPTFPDNAGVTYKERFTDAKIKKICGKISRYRSCKDLGDGGGAEILEGAITSDLAMVRAMLSEIPGGEDGDSAQAGRYRTIITFFGELKGVPVNLRYRVTEEPSHGFFRL